MNDDDITIWNCPKARCDGKLIRRRNKEGQTFLGCTEFPRCRYTQKDETDEK
jgi:ssDNA-binding Zn-finger/Zn-ribbon topoisomerase 1